MEDVPVDLRQLECFFALAEELHFGRAAERLNLGQPTVSDSLRRLEQEIGGRLFERTSRSVSLTPLGLSFLGPARDAFASLQIAYTDASHVAAGKANILPVGYVEDLAQPLLATVRTAFRTEHPLVSVLPSALATLEQGAAIRSGQIELGMGWDTPPSKGTRRTALARDPYVVIVPTEDPLCSLRHLSSAQVANRPLIMWPREINPAHRDGFTDWLTQRGHAMNIAHETVGTSNIIALVLAGLGWGVTTQSVASTKQHDGIAYRRLGPGGPAAARVLMTRNAPPRPPLASLMTLLKEAAVTTSRRTGFTVG
jgi:DNA-binding transcriptional LysR family regulator